MPKAKRKKSGVVKIVQENTEALFALAARDPEFLDRASPVRLEEYIAEQKWEDRVGKSTIYRMFNGEGPVGADTLELVARAFNLQAYHLLIPGLDPANPPVVLTSAREREFWEHVRNLNRDSGGGNAKAPAKREDDRGQTDPPTTQTGSGGPSRNGRWKKTG